MSCVSYNSTFARRFEIYEHINEMFNIYTILSVFNEDVGFILTKYDDPTNCRLPRNFERYDEMFCNF